MELTITLRSRSRIIFRRSSPPRKGTTDCKMPVILESCMPSQGRGGAQLLHPPSRFATDTTGASYLEAFAVNINKSEETLIGVTETNKKSVTCKVNPYLHSIIKKN